MQRELLVVAVAVPALLAQSDQPIDAQQTVLLRSNLTPEARRENDQGPVPGTRLLSRMALFLRRTPAQHAALDRLLEEQQDPQSPNFQKWLTPEEFAVRFGASAGALKRATGWLQSEGFTVESTARGRGWIVFSGTAGQVQNAFHTEIHRFQAAHARVHFAPVSPPSLPRDLQSIVEDIRGLDDFYFEPPHRLLPEYTAANGSHLLAPGDVAKIYGILPANAGKQSIVVVGQSGINVADIEQFRSTFQLPTGDPQTVLVGDDPGIDTSGGELEADADIEWAGALVPYAPITYVYAKDVMAATQQAIDQNLAPILSFSFGMCESTMSASDATAIRDLAQQANAQGITWIAASGDAGAAACDQGSYPATHGLTVSFPASLPEVTGIGGTEFNEGPSGAYWNNINGPDYTSAVGYIPEQGWNDTAPQTGLAAGGGGASVLYPAPSWQIGAGVPENGARNVPDLAFSASPSHDPYIVISGGRQYAAGGTSLATPVFAGILALASQPTGLFLNASARFGNINPSLYRLAADPNFGPQMFHDVTSGNNVVPCLIGSVDCETGTLGYSAGPGYDQVTGLGSLNASFFVGNFHLETTTTLQVSATQANQGTPVVFTVTVRDLNGNIPTGTVTLYDSGGNPVPAPTTALDSTGTAVITASLSGGPHSITAAFSANFPFGKSASAPVSLFVIPYPPQPPTLGGPPDKGTNVSVGTALTWNWGSIYATWDLYFGTTSPPPFWGHYTDSCNILGCFPSGLAANTTYYWQVVARNVSGTAASPIWSFTTSSATEYTTFRIAGSDKTGFAGDGGPANQALLNSASDVVWDGAGNLYVADTGNSRVRRMAPNGVISTIAGPGVPGVLGDGGSAASANLTSPAGMALDSQGNLYIADTYANRVRKVSPDGTITTVAGTGVFGQAGDGGPAVSAQLAEPFGLAVDAADNLYIATQTCVRKVAAGIISTFAGQCGVHTAPVLGPGGPELGDGGPATSALLEELRGIAFDPAGNLYIADTGDIRIRKVSNGIITTVASAGADWIAFDSAGNLYFTDGSSRVEEIVNGVATTVLGGGHFSVVNAGVAADISLAFPTGLRVDSAGRITFADAFGVVTLSPMAGPPVAGIRAGGVLNAGGLSPGPLAAGSIASVFGTFFLNPAVQVTAVPLPTTLAGLSIQLQSGGGLAAPLFYASAGQAYIQIPWELAGQSSVPVSAVLNGISSPAQSLNLAAYAPGIFTINGQGQGAVLDTSYRLVDSSNPASAGGAIQIFCTGLGAVTNPPKTGQPASGTNFSTTISAPTVTIGGVQAPVLFSGLAPGTVGEYQVNVQVPVGVTPGMAVPLQISIGGVSSNTVTIGLQ